MNGMLMTSTSFVLGDTLDCLLNKVLIKEMLA